MRGAALNPVLTEERAAMESALEQFKEKFNSASFIDEMKGAVSRNNLEETPEQLALSVIRELHRQYRAIVSWTEEAVSVARQSGADPLVVDRALLSLEFAKRREGYLWLEVLSFSDDSFVRSVSSMHQGELCLF